MTRSREWLVPLTGVGFVLLGIVSFIVGGEPKSADEPVGEIVDYYVNRLRPDWAARVERSLAGAAGTTTERSYRVTFSRGQQCLILGTAGMVADLAQPVYTLSAYGRESDSC